MDAPLLLLVHSPSVGPATWGPVAACLADRGRESRVPDLTRVAVHDSPPFWPGVVDGVLEGVAGVAAGRALVIVAHSNAGLFVPLIRQAVRQRVAGCVFVDAALPVPDGGETPIVDEEDQAWLAERADGEGRLPRWTDWYDQGVVTAMLPDPRVRERVVEEQPRLPLSYYRQRVPAPAGWDEGPATYVLFSEAYREKAEQARRRGWAVRELAGEHVHQVVDPEGVAELIIAAADDFSGSSN
jgi:hypothetical protein